MDTGHQERLFRLPVEVLQVQAVYIAREGWQLRVQARRVGDEWSSATAQLYSHLTHDELLDVVVADLTTLLEL